MDTKIEMGDQDSDGRQKPRHERIPAERVDRSKLQQDILNEFVMNLLMGQLLEQRKLKEFVMSSLMDQTLEQENMKEFMVTFLMNQKLETR